MLITPETLEKYLNTHYKGRINKNSQEEWILPSFANPSKMKLYVNVKKGLGYDFIGGAGYNAFQLIKELEGYETDTECESFLINTLKISFDPNTLQGEKEKEPKCPPLAEEIKIPSGVVPVLSNNVIAKQAVEYLKKRGITKKDIEKYHLMVGVKGECYRRVVIPFIEDKKIVWYQARAINNFIVPKYKNPKGVEKSFLVYNIDNLKNVALVTEGAIDAMLINGVALSGVTASDWQIHKIMNKNPEQIIIIPDNDKTKVIKGKKVNPGYQGALKTIEGFVRAGYPVSNIRVAFLSGGKDINDIGREKAFECIENSMPVSTKTLLLFKEKAAESTFLLKIV